MGTPEALDVQDITKVGVIVIVALLLIGIVLSFVITAVIGRLIIAVVVVVLAVLVWQQRTHVKNQLNAHKCDLKATFFGIHLDVPAKVHQACKAKL
jgi:protein-S-isoprenylcysteine O-methyltransferase Ste14